MNKRYLVTGGAGFVGSVIAKKLLASGAEVTIIDNLSNGKESNLDSRARFINGDLADVKTYAALDEQKFDAILHIAAQASNAISFRDPAKDLLDNQMSTIHLLEYARRNNIRRLLFTSSMSAYGQPTQFPTTENEPLVPDSPYAIHKAASEHYLRVYAKEFGLDWTTFRLYTTYGSAQNLDNLDQGLLSIYLAYLIKKIPVVVKGDLDRKRDIVHVNDVAEAIITTIDRPNTHGKTYNMCTGTSLTIRQLLDALMKEIGEDPATYPVTVLPGTPGDPPVTHGSHDAASRDFGFAPKVDPYQGIAMTVRQLKERPAKQP
jgi:UDP-glucose 4-epimerase